MLVEQLPPNSTGTDWICGDIHGEFSLLERCLRQVGFEPVRDRLFTTGDLIDRGPESPRAAEYLAHGWFHSVRGNHDEFLLRHREAGMRSLWFFNGGQWWSHAAPPLRREMEQAFSSLPLAITVATPRGAVGIVHADVPAGMAWDRFLARLQAGDPAVREAALWGRDRWYLQDRSGVAGLVRLYCGHTVVGTRPALLGNVLFLDTGATYQGTLALLPL